MGKRRKKSDKGYRVEGKGPKGPRPEEVDSPSALGETEVDQVEAVELEPVEPVAAEVRTEAKEPEPVVEESAATAAPTRRGFFRQAWLVLAGLAVLEYVWVALNFLRPRLTPEQAAGVVVAGPAENFEPGSVTPFPRGKFYLSRLDDGGFLALSRECTHLGCTVPWLDDEGRFICPCHASEYDQRGVVVSPPAPRPLDLFAVRIENGVVKVDTSEPLKRSIFEDSQVTEA
jgi:cytochrome b6-f complex iron-sulfur subunit